LEAALDTGALDVSLDVEESEVADSAASDTGDAADDSADSADADTAEACVSTVETCNGKDDDCDGTIDNGDPGGGAACSTALPGACTAGIQHCVDGAIVCVPTVKPGASVEVCNGLDDDCDGALDNGDPGGGAVCATGLAGVCSAGVQHCMGGAIACVPNATPGSLTESCNGLDDDCDGTIDEDIAAVGTSCTAPGFVGICAAGTYVCPMTSPTSLQCSHPMPATIAETCNGLDDDCNGTIDDSSAVDGKTCSTGLPGVCSSGTTLCSAGTLGCTPTIAPGTRAESCDGLDNNCNGAVDDLVPNPTCTAQNPSASFVSTWACIGGACRTAGCALGHADIDGAVGNGCECATDVNATSCGSAGTITVPLSATSNLTGVVETATGSDYVRFNFAVSSVGAAFHPKVQLVDSAGGQYAMDVLSSCAAVAGCSTTGGANNESGTAVSVWEANYNAYTAGPGCCSDDTPRVSSVIVRIYRKFANAPTCTRYTVTATNG
jgi:hypothetical protein